MIIVYQAFCGTSGSILLLLAHGLSLSGPWKDNRPGGAGARLRCSLEKFKDLFYSLTMVERLSTVLEGELRVPGFYKEFLV